VKNIYYICRDYQGSITHITNSSGSVVHTGHEHLGHYNLQLINMNARLYDPALGRFLSPDPYVQAPDFSQSFNRYSYCLNNPLKYTDADGEFWHIIIGAIVGGVVNLTSNWDNINGFWQGVTSFVVGAGAGAAVAATGGAGAGLWATAGVAASGGAVSAGTNN
jgi:RHS repeat-associated protein